MLIAQGEALAAELSATCKPGQVVKFLYTNVQDHLANLGLFELAYKTCGRVDHAASVAGINREENIVDATLTLESVRKVFRTPCFFLLLFVARHQKKNNLLIQKRWVLLVNRNPISTTR